MMRPSPEGSVGYHASRALYYAAQAAALFVVEGTAIYWLARWIAGRWWPLAAWAMTVVAILAGLAFYVRRGEASRAGR